MLFFETNQIFQYEVSLVSGFFSTLAWLLALVELILGMYALAQNLSLPVSASHQRARFWPCLILLLLASGSASIMGILVGDRHPGQLHTMALWLAGIILAIPPLAQIATLALLMPDWPGARIRFEGSTSNTRKKNILAVHTLLLIGLALLPALFLMADTLMGTRLWASNSTWDTQLRASINWPNYADGLLAPVLRTLNLRVIPVLTFSLVLLLLFSDKTLTPSLRRQARMLLVALVCVLMLEFGLRWVAESYIWGNILIDLAQAALYSIVYGWATIHQQISFEATRRVDMETALAKSHPKIMRRPPVNSLQGQMMVRILAGALPILFILVAFLVTRFGSGIRPLVTDPENQAQIIHFQRLAWGALIVGGTLLAAFTWFAVRQALKPLISLKDSIRTVADQVLEGKLNQILPIESTGLPNDESVSLANSFNDITAQLRELVNELEQRVETRTADLQRRALQLQTAAQVAREAAEIQDLKLLLNQAAQLISNRFGFYHAGIFLIDEIGEYAILQAASSQGGRRMLERGHKLRVGKEGIVGYVAETAKPRITLNVGEDSVYFNNPELPLTRSEMALPLKARGRVIGVLDVQSTNAGAFTEEDIEVLQILADQIALAIENARLLGEREAALKELEAQYGETTRQAWQTQIFRQKSAGKPIAYHYNRLEVQPVYSLALPTSSLPGQEQVSNHSSNNHIAPTIQPGTALHQITLPIIIRNQIIGSIVLRRDEDQEPWTIEDYNLAEEAIHGISQALENARLLDENQRRAQQERLISEVAAKVQNSLDLDTLMKTAVREIALATQAARVQIRLGSASELNSNSQTGETPERDTTLSPGAQE